MTRLPPGSPISSLDHPTDVSTDSIVVGFVLVALFPLALVAVSYPVATTAGVLGLSLAVALLRRLANGRTRLRLPVLDIEVSFSRPAR